MTSTTAPMTTEQYIERVVALLPHHSHARAAIAEDIRAHIAELRAHGATEEEAIERLGTPAEVAAAFAEATPSGADIPGDTLDRLIREWQGGLTLQYASFSQRVTAFVIDIVIMTVCVIGLVAISFTVPSSNARVGALFFGLFAYKIIVVASSVFYFPLLEWRWGQTIGKRVIKLRVVTVAGDRVSFLAAFVRRLPLFMQFFPLDALFALFTERHQRAFDIVARTVVTSDDPPKVVRDRLVAVATVILVAATAATLMYLVFSRG
jgi:uncharacterized RDD family membrane protein YckC